MINIDLTSSGDSVEEGGVHNSIGDVHTDNSESTPLDTNPPPPDPSGDRIEGKFVSDNVINLSKRDLSEAEIKVLSKGLKFCPTTKEISK